MSFDPLIGIYVLGFAVSAGLYIALHRRGEARSRATKAAAAEAGLLEPASLSQLEKGVFYASLKMVGKVAAVLKVEPAELLRLPPRRHRRR